MKMVRHTDTEKLRRQSIGREIEPLLEFVVHPYIHCRNDAIVHSKASGNDVVSDVSRWYEIARLVDKVRIVEDSAAVENLPVWMEFAIVQDIAGTNLVGSLVDVLGGIWIIELMKLPFNSNVVSEIEG